MAGLPAVGEGPCARGGGAPGAGGPGLAGAACRPGRGPAALPGARAARATRNGWRAGGAGRQFTPQERWWLDEIARHIGINLSIGVEDLNSYGFQNRGGQVAAQAVWAAAARLVR